MIIRLTGKTRRGKNIITNYGALWRVIEMRAKVQALNNVAGLLIESIKDGDTRWITQADDSNFTVYVFTDAEISAMAEDGTL